MFDRSIRVSLGTMQILEACPEVGLVSVLPRPDGYRSGDVVTIQPYDFQARVNIGDSGVFSVLTSMTVEQGKRIILAVKRAKK